MKNELDLLAEAIQRQSKLDTYEEAYTIASDRIKGVREEHQAFADCEELLPPIFPTYEVEVSWGPTGGITVYVHGVKEWGDKHSDDWHEVEDKCEIVTEKINDKYDSYICILASSVNIADTKKHYPLIYDKIMKKRAKLDGES